MFSRKRQRRADGHRLTPIRQPESSSTEGIVIALVNSVVVTVGGVHELTGSLLVSTVAGGLVITIVGLAGVSAAGRRFGRRVTTRSLHRGPKSDRNNLARYADLEDLWV